MLKVAILGGAQANSTLHRKAIAFLISGMTLHSALMLEPDNVIVLLSASTGVAAFNIGGMTLHSTMMLGCSKIGEYQSLSHLYCSKHAKQLQVMKYDIVNAYVMCS